MEGLHTQRLRFRRLHFHDVEWWMDYINSAEAIRFMPYAVGDRAGAAAMVQRSLDRYARDGSGLNAVELKATGEPIGQCGLLTQEVDGLPELEIGYHFLPAHWGQGYATEAAVAAREFARERSLAPSIISLIDEQNSSSRRVAERNGMVVEKRSVHRGVEALVYRIMIGGAV